MTASSTVLCAHISHCHNHYPHHTFSVSSGSHSVTHWFSCTFEPHSGPYLLLQCHSSIFTHLILMVSHSHCHTLGIIQHHTISITKYHNVTHAMAHPLSHSLQQAVSHTWYHSVSHPVSHSMTHPLSTQHPMIEVTCLITHNVTGLVSHSEHPLPHSQCLSVTSTSPWVSQALLSPTHRAQSPELLPHVKVVSCCCVPSPQPLLVPLRISCCQGPHQAWPSLGYTAQSP